MRHCLLWQVHPQYSPAFNLDAITQIDNHTVSTIILGITAAIIYPTWIFNLVVQLAVVFGHAGAASGSVCMLQDDSDNLLHWRNHA